MLGDGLAAGEGDGVCVARDGLAAAASGEGDAASGAGDGLAAAASW